MLKLRDYQTDAVNSAWGYLCSQAGSPVIVVPTGGGKSLVIAKLIQDAVSRWDGRVLVLAHRKELLDQNAAEIRNLVPEIQPGIYSAGLKSRNVTAQVICAGIQSCYDKAHLFGRRDLVLIDEAHLIPSEGEGQYRRFLSELRNGNQNYRAIGLTATPYRTGEGSVCGPDRIFQAICYEASIPKLIQDGYLCQLTSQAGESSTDTSSLRIRAGEFIAREMEDAFDKDSLAACTEIISKTQDRKSILIFASGVKHAEHVADIMEKLTGETVGLVTGDTCDLERSSQLADFKARRLRWLVNIDVLTTGFNARCVDCVCLLRATCSPGLYSQICGRGFRLYPEKKDCLILDFGDNIQRHGPLDAIDFGKPKAKSPGTGPTKNCPNCGEAVHMAAKECSCGWVFPTSAEPKHSSAADETSQILSEPKVFDVISVSVARHRKRKAIEGTPDTLRVDYLCQPVESAGGNLSEQTISEWVCVDHDGFAFKKAHRWWRDRCNANPERDQGGSFINSCIELWKRCAVALPTRITCVQEGRFWRVTNYELEPIPDDWEAEEELEEIDEWAEHEEAPF